MPRFQESVYPETPIRFTIVHSHSGIPNAWHRTFRAWASTASTPAAIEYILVTDRDKQEHLGQFRKLPHQYPLTSRTMRLPSDSLGAFRIELNKRAPVHGARFKAGLAGDEAYSPKLTPSFKIAITDDSAFPAGAWDRLWLRGEQEWWLEEDLVTGPFAFVAEEVRGLFVARRAGVAAGGGLINA